MTLPRKPFGGKGGNNGNDDGPEQPRQPKGIKGAGQYDSIRHSEPNISLGGPTPHERWEARREVSDAVRAPFSDYLAQAHQHPQDFVLIPNREGVLVGAVLDPTGEEIPESRVKVGTALIKKRIPAERVLSASEMAAEQAVISCGEVLGWAYDRDPDLPDEQERPSSATAPVFDLSDNEPLDLDD